MLLIRTQVRPSSIHGLGLFAVMPVPRGTPIWRFEAGFDRLFPRNSPEALPDLIREHLNWFAYVRREDGALVLSGDHACFMNHAAPPNTGMPPHALADGPTVALRDIAAGEELTCDYFAFDAHAARKLAAGQTMPVASADSGENFPATCAP